MTTAQIVLIVVTAILFLLVVFCWIFGRDYLKYHAVFSPIVKLMAHAVKTISGFLPSNELLVTIGLCMETAITATETAEQMWIDDTLDKSKRHEYAKQFIENALGNAGIEITPAIDSICEGVISFICMLMPHSAQE